MPAVQSRPPLEAVLQSGEVAETSATVNTCVPIAMFIDCVLAEKSFGCTPPVLDAAVNVDAMTRMCMMN